MLIVLAPAFYTEILYKKPLALKNPFERKDHDTWNPILICKS